MSPGSDDLADIDGVNAGITGCVADAAEFLEAAKVPSITFRTFSY